MKNVPVETTKKGGGKLQDVYGILFCSKTASEICCDYLKK